MSRPTPAHGKGWFEVQDAASQVAALLSGARPGETVADICAGAGGKTLTLAAMMNNSGKLVAHDMDRFRLRPIFERLTRAGVINCEVVSAQDEGRLEDGGAIRLRADRRAMFRFGFVAQEAQHQVAADAKAARTKAQGSAASA